jgi:hypothetical protein
MSIYLELSVGLQPAESHLYLIVPVHMHKSIGGNISHLFFSLKYLFYIYFIIVPSKSGNNVQSI